MFCELATLFAIVPRTGSGESRSKASPTGKATQLLKDGKSLGEVLLAGEWKSKAVLHYVDEDSVDFAQVFDQLSDDEEATPAEAGDGGWS